MMETISFVRLLEAVRTKRPLVHHITNYVTVNDCANITLAIGASPVMADDVEEAADIAAIASSVVLNMGTLNRQTVESMIAAGKRANQCGIPVIFDPVGAGASRLRNDTAARILREVNIAVLRGNVSEIRCVAGLEANTKGVDASEKDKEGDIGQIAQDLAKKLGCVVAVTGAIDTVSDGVHTVYVDNGHPALSGITGSGCMCSSLIGAFAGAVPEAIFVAAVTALACMGVAGEVAYVKAGQAGSGSFHMALIDAVSKIDADMLSERVKCHEA